ncbi:T9SS type A sorting domain-containing protein [Mariniflexile rhizosphaerae]|uniref:T9SS type A sorting domain-containing protein n=1 Tax=unclassified Mariniflexile TaxID=2643887 RepID=UPI00390CC68A
MKKITFLFIVLALAFNTVSGQTVFDWDTNAVDNGNNVTETKGGITVTFTNDDNTANDGTAFTPVGGFGGSSGNVVLASGTTSSTFTFDQPVVVNSILALEGAASNVVYTFTPTGGDNPVVEASLVGGAASVDLNWINVTSFTVTTDTGVIMGFDNLSVSSLATLSVTDDYKRQNVLVYPNPVMDILYVKNILNLKTINIYNNLGQLVLQTKQETIDVSHLSKGMYFLQINTSNGTETKRIIKK